MELASKRSKPRGEIPIYEGHESIRLLLWLDNQGGKLWNWTSPADGWVIKAIYVEIPWHNEERPTPRNESVARLWRVDQNAQMEVKHLGESNSRLAHTLLNYHNQREKREKDKNKSFIFVQFRIRQSLHYNMEKILK